jgi:mannose-6-phosphate isomerase
VTGNKPVRLPTVFKEKVWGSEELSPWYRNEGRAKIGEVWFEADLPLLVKFVFTSERLSVQVHPDDAYARSRGHLRGKTEMWHVLRADPGAQVALGFRETMTRERVRDAAVSGEIEGLLNWVEARAGDTFFTPAGTVHAIGGGLALCEIQQNSDITYRLYDYGRPRELHLDDALAVIRMSAENVAPVKLPVECEYFRTEAVTIERAREYEPDRARFHLLIFVEGSGRIAGDAFEAGEAWLVPAGGARFTIEPARATKALRSFAP